LADIHRDHQQQNVEEGIEHVAGSAKEALQASDADAIFLQQMARKASGRTSDKVGEKDSDKDQADLCIEVWTGGVFQDLKKQSFASLDEYSDGCFVHGRLIM
jgi:hypothetical protein